MNVYITYEQRRELGYLQYVYEWKGNVGKEDKYAVADIACETERIEQR